MLKSCLCEWGNIPCCHVTVWCQRERKKTERERGREKEGGWESKVQFSLTADPCSAQREAETNRHTHLLSHALVLSLPVNTHTLYTKLHSYTLSTLSHYIKKGYIASSTLQHFGYWRHFCLLDKNKRTVTGDRKEEDMKKNWRRGRTI